VRRCVPSNHYRPRHQTPLLYSPASSTFHISESVQLTSTSLAHYRETLCAVKPLQTSASNTALVLTRQQHIELLNVSIRRRLFHLPPSQICDEKNLEDILNCKGSFLPRSYHRPSIRLFHLPPSQICDEKYLEDILNCKGSFLPRSRPVT